MRLLAPAAVVVLLASIISCSRPNEDFCCVTAETCAAAGLTAELRPCDIGQACKAYGCVAAECASSADCTSPEAPRCLDGLCAAGCTTDGDCAGIAGRARCDASDATCVGCTSHDQCPAERAICDLDSRSCRGCTADEQCASGVCIEATGSCAADDAIIYVMETGADAGLCSRPVPCKTMSFALGLIGPTRNIIRVLGGYFQLGSSSLFLDRQIVIDGNDVTLASGVSPAISVGGSATLEGVRLSSTDAFMPLIKIQTGGSLALSRSAIESGQIEVIAGGALDASEITMRNGNIDGCGSFASCSTGAVSIT